MDNSTPTTLESRLFWIETTLQIYEQLFEESKIEAPFQAEIIGKALVTSRLIRDQLYAELEAKVEQERTDVLLEQARIDATGIPDSL